MPIDPVCHNTVDPRHAAAFCEYKGIVYYFCSSGCHKTFTADIRKYTDADALSGTIARTRDTGDRSVNAQVSGNS